MTRGSGTALAAAVLALALTAFPAAGASIDELQEKIAQRNADLAALEQDIAAFQAELDTVGKQKQSLKNALTTLDLSRRKLSTNISVTQNRIAATDLRLEELAFGIADKEKRLESSAQAVAAALRTIDAIDSDSVVEWVLRGNTFGEMWEQLAALNRVNDALTRHAAELSAHKADLEGRKQETETARSRLVTLNAELSGQRRALDANRRETASLLSATENKEANYQKLLAEKEALHRQFEQEVLAFESELRLAIDPSALPRTGSGVLAWPVDAVHITQHFGNTDFATKNPQIYNGAGHNAIDLRASPGTRIKAAGSGIVEGIGDTDQTCPNASYGKWVLIRHHNGLSTLYAHLSAIVVSQGQSVSTGQVIGYSGSTGYATGPHLHFTVYATQGVKIAELPSKAAACRGKIYTLPLADLKAYLNPLSYL